MPTARTLLLLAALLPASALAADPPPVVPTPVMGDKGRSGPDGWAQAPVARDQGAGAPAPGQSAANPPNAQKQDSPAPTLPPGQDPGTPATPTAASPDALAASPGTTKP